MKTIYCHPLQFARYPSLYVLGAFPAWLKVLSHNCGAVLLKKPKNVRDSVPLNLKTKQTNKRSCIIVKDNTFTIFFFLNSCFHQVPVTRELNN